MDCLIINNFQSIDQELRIKADHNILTVFFNIDLFIHRSHSRINLQFHFVICDLNDNGFFVAFSYKKCSSVNTVKKFFFVNADFCIVITGKHLINTEIFTFNQSRNYHRLIKFKKNMIFGKVKCYLIIYFTRKNLADFIKCFTWNYNLAVRIVFLQGHSSDRNTMSIQRNYFQTIILDFK